jgi:hypothetical protein
MSQTLTFTHEKDTKNTVRFSEDGDENVVGTLYVQKAAHEALGSPTALTVTIDAA